MDKFRFSFAFVLLGMMLSCKHKEVAAEETAVSKEDVQTPVTVTSITNETLNDSLILNATSSFVQDNIVKSTINGFIKGVTVKVGQFTATGRTLFTLKTKEAESLGNTINKLDPAFHFTGIVNISASQSGYITQLNHQVGDYVQDGEQLAVISDSKSFGFVLNVPYEYRRFITVGKGVVVSLPDGTVLNGSIASFLPTIDSVSQSQTVMVKVASSLPLPENLIAKVHLLKSEKKNAASLPKEAVLSNESQSDFWVMKMIDSVTAVKVSIVKGMEAASRVEVLSPKFSADDKILLSGNYGLPDTAKVKIVKATEE